MSTDADDLLRDDNESFFRLMKCAQEGSEEAVWELLQRYEGYVLRAVRRVLGRKLRVKFDSLDFVQSAWRVFFGLRGQMDRFESPRHFVKYVAGIACKKVLMQARHLATEKRDVLREVQLEPARANTGPELAGREPEPVDLAIVREHWERLMRDQPPHYRKILSLRLKGHSEEAVAELLGIHPQTVRRFLKKLLEERMQ